MGTALARAAFAGWVVMGLSACAANMSKNVQDRVESAPPLPESPVMVCNAAAAQSHVGHDATQAMGAAILKDAGARTLRWGPPGAAWTRDFRQDRVNVSYGGDMKITEITCG